MAQSIETYFRFDTVHLAGSVVTPRYAEMAAGTEISRFRYAYG